ncbi:Cytochrome p450 protein [Lasiodiplodia theobromae]|uniref:Cytochrome p450 protein n=1 Tax=Lasiodiplodia theobromae TaxID=45133 RepID=UPI0015C4041B|nr:Cytochrome p450 protein [Lasiodiplodia theobromae]KAF4546051.1 Cytochrome p450 protein [Lasiodiplodia theobromae]
MSAQNTTGVYTGVWTNWSRGRITGSTLTLTAAHGALLIAFLAFFITIITAGLWKIFTYILFHIFSAKAPDARDGLYHRRQAILRNSLNPLSGLIYLARSSWAWRHSAKRMKRRMLPVILFTAICIALFSLASGFSAKVATSFSSEALISSPDCLVVPYQVADESNSFTDEGSRIDAIQQAEFSHDLAIYAKECYSDRPTDAMTPCEKLLKPKLAIHSNTSAACPFSNSICRTNTSNIFLDSGLLDSHEDLGLNAPPEQRFKYRTTAHCAPLNTRGHVEYSATTVDNDTYETAQYLFGGITSNITFEAASSFWQASMYVASVYQLGTSTWSPGNPDGSAWIPIHELKLSDGLLDIIWLTANGIIYEGPVSDPWFKTGADKFSQTNVGMYVRDEPASPMACVQREQYCNPNLPLSQQCTALVDPYEVKDHVLGLWGNDPDSQNAMAWIMMTKDRCSFTFARITGVLRDASLLASLSMDRIGFQKALPDDQWHAEVRFWFSVKLAGLQRMFLSLARTPDNSSASVYGGLSEETVASASKRLCGNQKILSADHTSFNFAILVAIFVAGTLIIAIGWNLDRLYNLYARCRDRRRRKNNDTLPLSLAGTAYAQLEWWASDALQLQRLAHEMVGSGTWGGRLDSAPVTTGCDEKLATLDFDEERRRPLLKPLCGNGGASDSDTPSQNVESKDGETDGDGGSVGAGNAAHSSAMSV